MMHTKTPVLQVIYPTCFNVLTQLNQKLYLVTDRKDEKLTISIQKMKTNAGGNFLSYCQVHFFNQFLFDNGSSAISHYLMVKNKHFKSYTVFCSALINSLLQHQNRNLFCN